MKIISMFLILAMTSQAFASVKLTCSVYDIYDITDTALDSDTIDLSKEKAEIILEVGAKEKSQKFFVAKMDNKFFLAQEDKNGLKYLNTNVSLINRMKSGEEISFRVMPLSPDYYDLRIVCVRI